MNISVMQLQFVYRCWGNSHHVFVAHKQSLIIFQSNGIFTSPSCSNHHPFPLGTVSRPTEPNDGNWDEVHVPPADRTADVSTVTAGAFARQPDLWP